MAVSTAALIPRVRGSLEDDPFATQGSAASAVSVVAVTDGTDWEEGAVGEFQDNGEQFKVISVNVNDLTCFRGWNGTTAAVHAASSTILRGFSYSYQQVLDALTVALNRLWPYAYKAETITPFAPVAGTVWYNLTATSQGVIEANQVTGTAPSLRVKSFGIDGLPFRFRRQLPTTVVASGVGISFPGGIWHATANFNITTAARITGTTDISDDTTLPVGDALVTGALAYLLAGKQIPRVSVGINRDEVATVGSTARLQTGIVFEQQFVQKLQMLQILHDQLYPIAREWE